MHHAAFELEQQRIHHIVDHRVRALARGGVFFRAAAAVVRRAPVGPLLDIGHVPAVRAILLRPFLGADGHAVPLDEAPVRELRVRRRVHLDHPRAGRADPAEGIRVEVGAALLVGVPVSDLLGAREVLAYGGVERAGFRQGPGVLRMQQKQEHRREENDHIRLLPRRARGRNRQLIRLCRWASIQYRRFGLWDPAPNDVLQDTAVILDGPNRADIVVVTRHQHAVDCRTAPERREGPGAE